MENKTTDAAISFGNTTLVDQDLVKKMVAESIKAWELMHQEELNALKLELREVRTSQKFICAKYEDLKINYKKLQKINKNQQEILKSFNHNQLIRKFEKQKEKERLMRTNYTIGDKI